MLQIEGLKDEEKSDWLEEASGQSGLKTITQLTSGVRDQNRVNVFVNGKFAFSLDVKQVVDLNVKVGRKLSEEDLQKLQEASEFGKLYQRALEWALTRPRSLRETRDYLKRRQLKRAQTNRKRKSEELKLLPEIQDSAIKLVVERLQERGYVDDQKFAEYYVENRFVKKGVSRRRLEMELRKKGVTEDVIKRVLTESARDDKEELAKMVQKKWRKYSKEKLVAYLVRQGFRYDEVQEAVEQKYSENEAESFEVDS